jgi:hypothetical protein
MPVQRIYRVPAGHGLRSEVARLRGELIVVRGAIARMNDHLATAFPPPSPGGAISSWRGKIDLRERRLAVGWSQLQMIRRMRAVAAEDGVSLPVDESLKVIVSRWENGAHGIGDFYARILHHVFVVAEAPTAPATAEQMVVSA